MKFREGDRVRFISVDSDNAKFFRHGLENLEIRAVGSDDYRVWERDRSISWYVREEELEFFDKSQSAKIKRLLPKIEALARHPVFEIAEQAPVFLVNGRAYSVGEENSNEKDNFYEDEKRMALVEVGELDSLDGLILDRAANNMRRIGEAYARETQKELNVLKSLDGNLDVPQLIYKQVFPYLRDENYKDKVNELLGAEKREAVAAPEKKIKVTQSLEQIADEIGVEVKGLIEKIEKEGQELAERSEKQSKLDSMLDYKEQEQYTGSSLLGRAINGKNLAIVKEKVYELVNKSDGSKQHIQINGRKFYLAERKELKRELKTNFEVGDEIIMNAEANSAYGCTKEGSKGVIKGDYGNGSFSIEFTKLTGWDQDEVPITYSIHKKYMKNLSEIVTENEANAKGLEEKFLVELSRKIRIDALKEHLSRDKIIEILKTQNEELLAIAGKKEYKEEGFGFVKHNGNYYAYLDVPSFAIKSHSDGNYYLFDKSRVGIQVRKNGAELQYGSIVIIDNIRHPLTDVDGLYQRMCLGANNLLTSGKDTGEVIAKRLKKAREIAIFGYALGGNFYGHRKLGICDCGVEHYKDNIITEEKAISLGVVIADARRKIE